MAEKFSLKWNDFSDTIQTSFKELRNDQDFADVTLACGDQSIEAHKVVLLACSPTFKNILKRNKHPHPLIYMRGMKPDDLTALVDFMYYGEVNIFQKDLSGFLSLAEEMQLKGLADTEEQSAQHQASTNVSCKQTQQNSVNIKQEAPENPTMKPQSNWSNETRVNVERRIVSTRTNLKQTVGVDYEASMNIETLMACSYGRWICRVCQFNFKSKDHLKEHVQTHMALELPCTICWKTLRTNAEVRMHKRNCYDTVPAE